MNESLADYTLLNNGDAMTYNKDYLPFIHSMKENVINLFSYEKYAEEIKALAKK